MHGKTTGRRRFLKGSATLGLAAGLVRPSVGQSLHPETIKVTETRPRGLLSPYENLQRTALRGGANAYTPIQDLKGIITPADLHFVVDHENSVLLNMNPKDYRLNIGGMVDRPLVFTLDELKRLPSVSHIVSVNCEANGNLMYDPKATTAQLTHGRTSTNEWTGVLLSTLLNEAGIQKGAKWIAATAADPSDHTASIPIEKAMHDMTIVAYAQNGESILIDNGYPVRLIVPGYAGRFLVKWLTQIKVVDDALAVRQDGYALEELMPDGRGYLRTTDKARAYRYDMTARSVITYPSGGQQLSGPGYYEITGLAWTGQGTGLVNSVEVSTDAGTTWKRARLQEPVLPYAHTRFRFAWNWDGQECIIQSRCIDNTGEIQPAPDEISRTWGNDPSNECHSVMGDLCERIPRNTHNSAIMSWKIATNGAVTNPVPDMYPKPHSLGHSDSGGHNFVEQE